MLCSIIYIFLGLSISCKRRRAVKAKRDTHSDNGQRSKTRGALRSLPKIIQRGSCFRAYRHGASGFRPGGRALIPRGAFVLVARCIFVLIPHRCMGILFWENPEKPLKNGRCKINKFVNLFPFWNFFVEKSTKYDRKRLTPP